MSINISDSAANSNANSNYFPQDLDPIKCSSNKHWNSIFSKSDIDTNKDKKISADEANTYLTNTKDDKSTNSINIKSALKALFGIEKVADFTGVKQGKVGDCWLISPLLALSQTTNGKSIIEQVVKINNDKTVTVTFLGAKPDKNGNPWSQTFSNKKVADFVKKEGATNFSMAAIELAFTEYQNEKEVEFSSWTRKMDEFKPAYDSAKKKMQKELTKNPQNQKAITDDFNNKWQSTYFDMLVEKPIFNKSNDTNTHALEGNKINYALRVIAGLKTINSEKLSDLESHLETILPQMNENNEQHKNNVCTVVFKENFKEKGNFIYGNHAYSILKTNDTHATLQNTDSSTLILSLKRLKENCNGIALTNTSK